MTGRYPMRCGMPVARNAGFAKYRNYGISPDELTIPELLKPAGYRSLMVGKWHLGIEVEGSHPIDAGFDEHLGIPSNFSRSRGVNHNTLYRGKQVEAKNLPFEALTKRYTDEAVAFIEKQNVAAQHPEKVARLQQYAEAIRAELGDVDVQGSDQRAIKLVDPQER